ncbi:outer membrane protein assembly factor BamE [Candidatus Pelagibacter sp.]|nr:outer membrane protein assembly factor BamE [Candidatus Pelagibacter sp.]
MKYLYIIILLFVINCSGNKVSNHHGSKLLYSKYDKIQINVTNKNDLIKIIGPPSSISTFNKNKWFYIERVKTNLSIFKLGKQKIKTNNILILEINQYGILENKSIINIDEMNNVKFVKTTTTKDFEDKNLLYDVFSSLREKINAPVRKKTN